MNVIIKKCDEYVFEDVLIKMKEIFDLLGGVSSLIKPNSRVFIKCNCLGPFDKDLAITTHPTFLKAVISIVKEVTTDITVGDNPATRDLLPTLKKNGLYEVIVSENVKILDNKLLTTITNPNYKIYNSFEVSSGMLDCDVLINLPKLKTHSLAYMTCAEKNLFGFVYGLNKSAWHLKTRDFLEFSEAINDLYGAILNRFKDKTIINICDGIYGLEGDGPSTGGKPINSKLILASLDAVGLDRVALKKMGLDHNKSLITKIAAERNLGEANIDNIKILGDEVDDLKFLEPKNTLTEKTINTLRNGFVKGALLEHPKIDPNKCIKCGECTKICPPKAMTKKDGKYPRLNISKCIRCWCCAEVCPKGAINKTKRPIIGKILLKEAKK